MRVGGAGGTGGGRDDERPGRGARIQCSKSSHEMMWRSCTVIDPLPS